MRHALIVAFAVAVIAGCSSNSTEPPATPVPNFSVVVTSSFKLAAPFEPLDTGIVRAGSTRWSIGSGGLVVDLGALGASDPLPPEAEGSKWGHVSLKVIAPAVTLTSAGTANVSIKFGTADVGAGTGITTFVHTGLSNFAPPDSGTMTAQTIRGFENRYLTGHVDMWSKLIVPGTETNQVIHVVGNFIALED